MKKVLFASLSLAALLFSSACTNDDITIEKVLPRHSVSYNVSTQDMYDTFGQVNFIRENYLREDTLCIGVTTFVYNSNGELVDNKVTTLKNVNSAQQIFENLVEGSYTFITVETILNPINNNKSRCWSFDDINNMSTLNISQIRRPSRINILGVCTQKVLVSGDETIAATPKAIGSLINFHCYNFKNSNYYNLGFGTQDILKYYSLSPDVQGKDKYNRDLTASKEFNLRGAITPESSETKYLPIYVLESDIDWKMGIQDESRYNTTSWLNYPSKNAILEDGKVYEAGFYYLFDEVEETYFGDMAGLNSWKTELDGLVKSLTAVYEEPFTTWGSSVASVKSYMANYNFGGTNTNDNGSYVLWYYGKNREDEIDYYFESANGGLFMAYVFLNSEEVGEDELSSAFNELGYTYVGSGDGYSTYKKNPDVYLEVGLNEQNYWYVAYYNPAMLARQYSPARSIRAMIPKREFKNSYDRRSIMNKLRSCDKAISEETNR